MLSIRLSSDLENRLVNLADKTGRAKSYYIRKAIEHFLDEEEEYYLAINRLERNNSRISLKEVERQLGLED